LGEAVTTALADRLAAGLAEVDRRISSAGGVGRVRVLPMTKGFGPDAVEACLAAGLEDVGESYAQELVSKSGALGAQPRWHFAGRLQRNKVRALAPLVVLWQSVDRPSLVDELARRAPGAHVLVQIDPAGDPARGGCRPEEAAALVRRARDAGLVVDGVMAVGPVGPPADARPVFRRVASVADELGLVERSMGMSADLEVAVEEGSTMVRVGTALFGARPV
jgi:pyridoxal phosphate enzyme (YggS family)